MRLPPDDTDLPGPNMTPVIDVVFLLLIFFLVATRMDQQELEVPAEKEEIALPEVPSAQPMVMPPDHIVVNVTRDGAYIVNGEQVSEQQLLAIFRAAGEKNPGTQTVLVRGDGDSLLKHTARVLQFGNLANLKTRIRATPEGT